MARGKLITILGPTAVGKTSLAIDIALALNTEIVSADSRQFFHEMNIGVARPSKEELAKVKHYFIDFISIHDEYSAGAFERDAMKVLEELFEKHTHVVCSGGSGLYIKALLEGFDDLPCDPLMRKRLIEQFEKEGLEGLQMELNDRDPLYFSTTDIANPHRVIRALEVIRISGKAYSSFRTHTATSRPFDCVKIGLRGDRNWLYKRISLRVDTMVKEGLREEVKELIPFENLNALNTVGYKEYFDYFDNKCTEELAIESIKRHTRNYAKRQLTWWKRDEEIRWIEMDRVISPLEEALKLIH